MKVAFATLGCKVNQYDTATIETTLRRHGYTLVPFDEGADAYVVNTCSVTDRADAESRQLARRARRFNPGARVILTGCFAQTRPERAAGVTGVDYVVGIGRLGDVLRAVRGEIDAAEGRIFVDDLRKAERVTNLGAEAFGGQTRAFLKVQEGCDLFCTFCIVPFARGRSRSVEPRRVLEELRRLADRGFQEVVLTGIHLGSYGRDLHPRVELADLLESIDASAPAARVRLSSVDPPEVTSRVLSLLSGSELFCSHLHVPVQAGSDAVLRRMRRKYDTALVRDVVQEIVRALPDAGLGTDVIAGFPGETQSEFEAGLAFLGSLPFTYFHVFPYSRRSGTTAARDPRQLAPAEIAHRARALRKLGDGKRRDFVAAALGRELDVLVEGHRDRASGLPVGYSSNYVRVLIAGGRPGCDGMLRVRVVAQRGDRAVGVPVSKDDANEVGFGV